MRNTPTTPTGPTNVLIVDDDDDLRALVSATLRADGYTVVEATDGLEAIDHVKRGLDFLTLRTDIMLTDVRMPNLSGLGLLEALTHAHVVLPIIVMTVMGDDSVRTVAKRLGAVGVLHKPFELDDLRSAILDAEQALVAARAHRVV
jgi:CheY-like chemotaxis protein